MCTDRNTYMRIVYILTCDNMKFKEIPREILESDLVGEMMAWNLLDNAIDKKIPNSSIKSEIRNLIADRQAQIMESGL